jgi:hypothetical protein
MRPFYGRRRERAMPAARVPLRCPPAAAARRPESCTAVARMNERIFVLSPASVAGRRADVLLREQASFDVARRVRAGEATLGEAFGFLSGLYFRGKLAYATAFARPPAGVAGTHVITTSRGLLPADTRVGVDDLLEFRSVRIDAAEPRYREPLCATAAALAAASPRGDVVLLGSVASGKYVDLLLDIFGARLLFPAAFVGRGDMSRGGLLLRAAADGIELDCIPVAGATRRGGRPPRLEPRPGLLGRAEGREPS